MPTSPILDAQTLRVALEKRGLAGIDPQILAVTGSTNAVLIERAAEGAAGHGALVAARHQDSARGRLDRTWTTPADSALLFSLLVEPHRLLPAGMDVSPDSVGLIPLAAGSGIVQAVRSQTGLHAELKWPNDVLVGGLKLAGILCQLVPMSTGRFGVVVGVGLNVRQKRTDLPVPTATSLAAEGVRTASASDLLAECAGGILEQTRSILGTGDLESIRRVTATIGSRVRVERVSDDPTQDEFGQAVDIAPSGALVVRTDDGSEISVQAGDVWHVRGAATPRSDPRA
jgi:BirA family biotin operon repressor/biotin-[acetyl-CoA-carboxylase] ligase